MGATRIGLARRTTVAAGAVCVALCAAAAGAGESWRLGVERVHPAREDGSVGAHALRALFDSGLVPAADAPPRGRLRHPGLLVEFVRSEPIAEAADPGRPRGEEPFAPWRLAEALGVRTAQLQVLADGDALRLAAILALSPDAPGFPLKNLALEPPAAAAGSRLEAAMSIDPGRFVAWALEVARRLGPGEAQFLGDMLAIARWNLLLDVERDVLGALEGTLRLSAWEGPGGEGLAVAATVREPGRLASALNRLAAVSCLFGSPGTGLRPTSFGGEPGWLAGLGQGLPSLGVALVPGEILVAMPAETLEAGPRRLAAQLAPGGAAETRAVPELGGGGKSLVLAIDVSAALRAAEGAARSAGLDEAHVAPLCKLAALGGTAAIAARLEPRGIAVWGAWLP